MNQDILLEALTAQLNSLAGYVNASLVIALLTFWAGLMRTEKLEIAGLKISRRYATFVIGVAFAGFNLSVLFTLMRLDGTLSLIDGDNFATAVSRLGSHPWLLNPFSYCGRTFNGWLGSCWSFGGLIVAWWFCNTALYLVADISLWDRIQWSRSIISGVFGQLDWVRYSPSTIHTLKSSNAEYSSTPSSWMTYARVSTNAELRRSVESRLALLSSSRRV